MKKKQTSRKVTISSSRSAHSRSSSSRTGSGVSKKRVSKPTKSVTKKASANGGKKRMASSSRPSFSQQSIPKAPIMPELPDLSEYGVSPKSPSVQKPLLLTFLCLIVVVTFAVALSSFDDVQRAQQNTTDGAMKNLRKGQQVASVTILPPGQTAESMMDDTRAGESADSGSASSGSASVEASAAAVQAAQSAVSGAVPAGERVKFAIDQFRFLATQPLKFDLFDEQGNELTPDLLQSVQGEKIHFFLRHANLREFQHLIPSYENGIWNVSASMPTPGTYSAYLSFSPIRGKQTVLKYDLVVRDASAQDIALPPPTQGLKIIERAIETSMQMQRTDYGRVFNFNVRTGDRPIVVEPYFETLGQITLFKHDDPNSFVTLGADPFSNENLGLVSFASKALAVGRWTAFVEVKAGGTVYIFPFTFDIGAV